MDDFRSRFPGYPLDAARRIVAADATANPYGRGGFNPHAVAIPVELDDAAELRRMRESIAMRGEPGEPDPAA